MMSVSRLCKDCRWAALEESESGIVWRCTHARSTFVPPPDYVTGKPVEPRLLRCYDARYFDDGYLSKFSRSGVTAVSDFIQFGFMESDAVATARLNVPLMDSCHPAGRRPNIIMIHDESSFDIREAGSVKVPKGSSSGRSTDRNVSRSWQVTMVLAGGR